MKNKFDIKILLTPLQKPGKKEISCIITDKSTLGSEVSFQNSSGPVCKPLKCFYLNARSLCNKIPQLHDLLSRSTFDIIFVTETWLTDSLSDALLLTTSGYSIFRHDRNGKKGGGVAIIYKTTLHLKNIKLNELYLNQEFIICELSLIGYIYRFVLCYRPPGCIDEWNQQFIQCLKSSCESSNNLILVGDFNFPELKWDKKFALVENSISSNFFELVSLMGLKQLVKKPTLGNNILDLIFCTNKSSIIDIKNCEPFSTSDHDTLTFKILVPELQNEPTKPAEYDFRKADYGSIVQHLSIISWPDTFSHCITVDDFYATFLNILHSLITLYVPFKKFVVKKRKKYPKNILKLQKTKRQIWRKYKKDTNFKNKYADITKQVDAAILNHYSEQEKDLLKKGYSVKLFYNFVNKRLNIRKPIPDLDVNGTAISDAKEKGELFNNFFASVFTTDNGILPQQAESQNFQDYPQISFDRSKIVTALCKLKPTFSVGPDGLCAYFIKQIKEVLVDPLATLFEVSYRLGELPQLWSEALVTPVFKKGDPHCVENYRPISLCCILCKVMESILNDQIMSYFSRNNILSPKQHGFVKNKSCATQLLMCKNEWSKSLDDRSTVDVVYIDFCKAFDSVVHSKLLLKLEQTGIKGTLLTWIKAFLSNRSQKVKINGQLSEPLPVTSGVPQGSVLGPSLFLVYINDLVQSIQHSKIMLFADDLKIFNTSKNSTLLQSDLNSLESWTNKWQLTISYKKCSTLYLGNKNPKIHYNLGTFDLVDAGPVLKDLGVHISNDISSSIHCTNIASKAARVSALIYKTFFSKDVNLMKKAFLVYVRPILEYCSVVWNPYLICDINRLEKVQRKFTKKILYKNKGLSYDQRLEFLKIEKLETRRIHSDLILAYKVIRDKLLPFEEFFEFTPKIGTRSIHDQKLYISKFRLDCRKYDFANRTARIWNELPQEIIDCQSISSFKASITKVDFRKFLKGRV